MDVKSPMLNEHGRVAVGMSGGVDSAVAAALLVEAGYEVTGIFLDCWKEPGCRTDQDRKDAVAVALKLGIPFKVLDFKKEYKRQVVDYFYSEYKKGRTPNPDVRCNKEIKFGLFYDWAMKSGFSYVATGHYARIRKITNRKSQVASYFLWRGVDGKKDQSYFLYVLQESQLAHILFPVGHLTKKQVRQEAKKRELLVADKPDSQGICFIGEIDVREFLKRKIKPKKGAVVDVEGNVIGEHEGVWFYTIGQRHGFHLGRKARSRIARGKFKQAIPPLYVVDKDVGQNRLVVGFGAETYRDKFTVEEVHWISSNCKSQATSYRGLRVRIRHGGKLIAADLGMEGGRLEVKLKEPQRGIAAGQAAVFYREEECCGGGVIQ